MIIEYKNRNHFNLIYENKELNNNNSLFDFSDIKIDKCINSKNIEMKGTKYINKYVQCNSQISKFLYDEINIFLLSIEQNADEIKKLKLQMPKVHINQIYSYVDLIYLERISKINNTNITKRRNFRKLALKYKIDKTGRLCILNPFKDSNVENKALYYKIPYLEEKEILVNNIHISNNHSGREATYQIIKKDLWYWSGMYNDILKIIKKCAFCIKPLKYKNLISKNKIIIEDDPHYRYIGDIWQLPQLISDETGYQFVLYLIDHFSKWYGGYLLKSKNSKEILKNIEIYFENFGFPKIFQVDNGGEFSNKFLDSYCEKNIILLIHSNPYHPQTNGAYESVHKEIKKYIYDAYIKKKDYFNIEEELFKITKIHNNKMHSTTGRIPKEIRDLNDKKEIDLIKENIIKTLSKKIKM